MSSHPRILVAEPFLSGHRMVYVKAIVRGGIDANAAVTLVVAPECEHVFVVELAEAFPELTIERGPSAPSPQARSNVGGLLHLLWWMWYRGAVRQCARATSFDLIIAPSADKIIYASGVLGVPSQAAPWLPIVISPSFHRPVPDIRFRLRSALLRWTFGRAAVSARVRRVLSIDPSLVRHIASVGTKKLVNRTGLLPHPHPAPDLIDRATACGLLGLPADRQWILALGVIDQRKSLDVLLSALIDPRCPKAWGCFVVGSRRSAVLDGADADTLRAQDRLVWQDRRYADDELSGLMAAATAVWVYRDRYLGMSGIQIEAASHGRPTICGRIGATADLATTYALGPCVSGSDGLIAALTPPERISDEFAAHGKAADLASQHGESAYRATIAEAITQPCDRPGVDR